MKDLDILEDILQYRVSNQVKYNKSIIDVRNPEVRQAFTELRDDEMRAVVKLQQKIERLEAKPAIISKIFPTKTRF